MSSVNTEELKRRILSTMNSHAALFEMFEEAKNNDEERDMMRDYCVIELDGDLTYRHRINDYDPSDSRLTFSTEKHGWLYASAHGESHVVIKRSIHNLLVQSCTNTAEAISKTIELANQTLETIKGKIMSNKRRTVTISLIDPDCGLDEEHSLVARYENIITSDDDSTTIQELCVNEDVGVKILEHNELRATQIDKDILSRTGNTVKLLPVKLKDLQWEIK